MWIAPQFAEQTNRLPEVSAEIVTASQPLEESGSGSNVQLTVTVLRYQPLDPTVPRITGVIDGLAALVNVRAEDVWGRSTTAKRAARAASRQPGARRCCRLKILSLRRTEGRCSFSRTTSPPIRSLRRRFE